MFFSRSRSQSEDGVAAEYRPLAGSQSVGEGSESEKTSSDFGSTDLAEDALSLYQQQVQRKARRSGSIYVLSVLNLVVFAGSLVLFWMTYRGTRGVNQTLKDRYCTKIPIVDQQINGELFPAPDPKDDLIGRLEPGPETDAMWEDWEVQRSLVLTKEQVIALGKDPEMTVKYPDEQFGLGDDAYMGGLDTFHVLHCFNAIRQEAFKDYYWDGERYHWDAYGADSRPKRRHSELYWLHLRHCTDIVVQNLMCNADPAVITMTWLESQDRPWMDFSVNKKCVDFDAITRWRDANALPVAQAGALTKPDWVRGSPQERRIDDLFYRLYGNGSAAGDKFHHPLWEVDEHGMPVH